MSRLRRTTSRAFFVVVLAVSPRASAEDADPSANVPPEVQRTQPAVDRSPHFFIKGLASARDLQVGGEDLLTTAIPTFGAGAELGLSFASRSGKTEVAPAVRYELGSTAGGLTTHTFLAKINGKVRLGTRVRWSIGAELGALLLARSTNDKFVGHWGIGPNTSFEIDLLRGEERALFLAPELDALVIPHKLVVPRSLYVGGSLGIGARF